MEIDWKLVNDRLKGHLIYLFMIAVLVLTIFWMIGEFNKYESELHIYYRDLMTKQGCLPTGSPVEPLGSILGGNMTYGAAECVSDSHSPTGTTCKLKGE